MASSTDSSHSSSTIVFNDKHRMAGLLLSCCQCARKRPPLPLSTIDPPKVDVQQGFFERMQVFKARKRQTSTRKQQLFAAMTPSVVSNGHLTVEAERMITSSSTTISDGQGSPPTYQSNYESSINFTHHPIRASHSIPSLNRYEYLRHLNHGFDTYSFTDIEVASSNTTDERTSRTHRSLPRHTVLSRHCSSGTTDLSAYSTQSLLRKLLDKAHVLDEYYNHIWNRTTHQSSVSLASTSSNSFVRRSRSLRPRQQSDDESKKFQPRPYRHFGDNLSSESSRLDLYVDEDNVLKELVRFNNDIDLILSRLEMEGESIPQPLPPPADTPASSPQILLDEDHAEQTRTDSVLDVRPQINEQDHTEPTYSTPLTTMRTNNNEINVHLLLANDVDRLRQAALSKLLRMVQQTGNPDRLQNYSTITLAKLGKLPKAGTWKGKRVFGVPLRVYQQTTGHILPLAMIDALQYVRMHAGKCDGLFRKPGVKSKIDRLRLQIETSKNESHVDPSSASIQFDEYQPFVVADVIRQYFRELPECLIPPCITRLLCDLMKCVTQDEQTLAIRYAFLLLPDENREVMETILRFLLDVSIRSGNSQTTCRSLARIFLPSVFQSYYDLHPASSKFLWWKRKKEKFDAIQQENERLSLEQCLMTMILNVDLLCRVPGGLTDELLLPSAKKTKRLDDLIRNACNGDFQMKKYISKDCERFLQRLATTKFKHVTSHVDGVSLSLYKPSSGSPSDKVEVSPPTWKCSIDIPNVDVKQICHRILHERHRWDKHFVETRTVEKIDEEKDIVQYVLNFLDPVPVRSFCEFRFSKKITPRSMPHANAMLISAISIDHLQNHFLPGTIGITHDMHYYVTPSATQTGSTTVTQVASVDYSGRSSQWYEQVLGPLLAHNLVSLRDSFDETKPVRV